MHKDHIDKQTTDIQYKTIHGRILDKLTLLHMKIQKDAICNRCNMEIEDIYHLFHTCTHSKLLWTLATQYINTVIGTHEFTWNSFKWILLGFNNAPFSKHLTPALEDIRLAYFYTIWYTRNQAMWHNNRAETTHKQHNIDIFNDSYAKIYHAGKARKFPTALPSNPSPTPTQHKHEHHHTYTAHFVSEARLNSIIIYNVPQSYEE